MVPVIGGLIVGLMARFGSDKIRGHGIPEAIEAILLNGAKVDPIIAVLKPISAAIAIGSGGPFGAEGPIIMTGGAVRLAGGAMDAPDRRRADDAAGGGRGGRHVGDLCRAAGGDSAGGGAAALRVAAAQPDSGGLRQCYWRRLCVFMLLGPGPLFAMPAMPPQQIRSPVAVAALCCSGWWPVVAAAGLSQMMYGFEDMFERLPVHWMWWPAIRRSGHRAWAACSFRAAWGWATTTSRSCCAATRPLGLLVGLVMAKSLMWASSLGSGTSGGVLAPLLMIGGAMGALAAHAAHASGRNRLLWAAVGMGAMLSGSLGVPLTAIVFCLEITHSLPALLPVMVGCLAAYLGDVAYHAALDPDRKAQPSRVPPDAGVRDRSA